MKIVNPETGATISGELGDNIGRGGRTRIYFKDESAFYEHPEMVEASLLSNTRVQIDIRPSMVSATFSIASARRRGLGTGAQIPKGKTRIFVWDWSSHPEKTQAWFDLSARNKIEQGLLHIFKSEVERDYSGAVEGTVIPAEWV
jgi:hypothetical protein